MLGRRLTADEALGPVAAADTPLVEDVLPWRAPVLPGSPIAIAAGTGGTASGN